MICGDRWKASRKTAPMNGFCLKHNTSHGFFNSVVYSNGCHTERLRVKYRQRSFYLGAHFWAEFTDFYRGENLCWRTGCKSSCRILDEDHIRKTFAYVLNLQRELRAAKTPFTPIPRTWLSIKENLLSMLTKTNFFYSYTISETHNCIASCLAFWCSGTLS